jgi:Putative Ig domain/Cohesin domain
MKTGRIFWALIVSLALLVVPAYSAAASAAAPTIASVYVTAFSQNVPAGGNNGTTTTVTITGANLTGVTTVTFLLGTTPDPLITVVNIVPNGATPDTKFQVNVVIDPSAVAGARNVTLTTPSGTSPALTGGFTVYRASISVNTPGGATPGGTFTVTINVNNMANLNAYQFDLTFDPTVIQVNGVENSTGASDGLIHDPTLGDKTISWDGWTFQPTQGIPSGTIRVLGQMGSANKSATGAGYLTQISFSVVGAVGAGTNLTLSNLALPNVNASNIVPDTVTNGSVTVIGLSITNSSPLPSATNGVAYTADIFATGGTSPYSWSSTGLPSGLNINVLNTSTGRISGTPSVSGNFSVNITVIDSTTPSHNQTTKTLSLTVYPVLQITTSSLPEATQNVIYSGTTVSATGGKNPYSWSWSATPSLPTGLTLDSATGAISGTPTVSGNFNITITVTDAFSPHNSTNVTLALHVYPALQITTASLPAGALGSSYSAPVTAGGGKTSYSWTWSSATGLPPGLNISSSSPTNGLISGTPTASGAFSVTVTVTDSFSPANTSSMPFTLLIGQGVTITSTSLPNATQNVTYSGTTVSAAGGTAPYSWSTTGLPAGLSFDPATRTISGTPTVSGNFTVNITVTDSSTPPGNQVAHLSLAVYPQLLITTSLLTRSGVEVFPANPPSFWTIPPPGWVVNQPYTATLTATGGKGTYSWSASGLPPGLTLDPATGIISGTPNTPNTASLNAFNISVTVTDSFGLTGNSSTKVLALKIYLAGDANGDGAVTIGDVTYVERVLLGLNAPTAGCDANLSGVISIGDVTRIERISLGLP